MTFRIDNAKIVLDVWDDTLGMRRAITFETTVLPGSDWESKLREKLAEHSARVRAELRTAKDGGGFVL